MTYPPTPRLPLAAACLGLLVMAAPSAPAGTIEVQILDDDGSPVPRERFRLHPPLHPGQQTWMLPGNQNRPGMTDDRGRATITGLPAGQYTVSFDRLATAGVVAPQDNPLAVPPVVTLADDLATESLVVRLTRGVPVAARVDMDDARLRRVALRLRDVDSGYRRHETIPVGSYGDLVLVPGRWELALDPPAGYFVTRIEIDGTVTSGAAPVLELRRHEPVRYVAWSLEAPQAILKGSVAFQGPPVRAVVEARLLEPGAWIDSVGDQPQSSYRVFRTAVDQSSGEYWTWIRDGRWQVTVIGERISAVDPETVEVEIGPGGDARADFTVATEEGGGLWVRVHDPQGRGVSGAIVELWRQDDESSDEPLRRGMVRRTGVHLRGVPQGDYRVVAGHPEFLEGRVALPEFDPGIENNSVDVTLRPASEIRIEARDLDGALVPGVRVVLDRSDESPPHDLAAPSLARRVDHLEALTDSTGRAWIRGVWPGRYTAHGAIVGDASAAGFVRFEEGSDRVKRIEVEVPPRDGVQLAPLVLPAASIAARLQCIRDQALPSVAALAVLPLGFELADLDPADEAWLEEAAIVIGDAPLSGPEQDTVLAGPLEDGSYHLAVRPAGHARWTWALGVEHPQEATAVQALAGERADLGTLPVDCGPALNVRPRSADGTPVPDLTDVHPRYDTATVGGVVETGDGPVDLGDVIVDSYPDRLVVRDLPEGEARLEIAIRHPYFLPEPWVRVAVERTLERGESDEIEVVVPGIGGALRLFDRRGAFVEVLDGEVVVSSAEVLAGRADVPSLPAGSYSVRLCDDATCRQVIRRWDAVHVEPLATITLD